MTNKFDINKEPLIRCEYSQGYSMGVESHCPPS